MARIEAAITERFDSQREYAIRRLHALVATATRELEKLEAGQFSRTDWIQQDAALYHDHLTSMIAISEALGVAHYYETQEVQS